MSRRDVLRPAQRLAALLLLCLAVAMPARADTAAELYRRHEALEQSVTTKATEQLAGRIDARTYEAHVVQTRFAQDFLAGELKKLAAAGDADAAHFLGLIHWDAGDLLASSLGALPPEARQRLQGRVAQSYRDATALFEQAAKAGHAGAAWNLGRMNELGKAAPASHDVAAQWYFKAGAGYLGRGERDRALRALEALDRIAPGAEPATKLRALIEAGPARPAVGPP